MDDLTGMKFGYLEVIRINNIHRRGRSWLCKCICGKEFVLSESWLIGKSRNAKSCGCVQYKLKGLSKTEPVLYRAWKSMKYRCYCEKDKEYSRYGGRGITVCDEWKDSFVDFMEWSKRNGYSKGLTLDRIDNDKDYSPENCRWTDYYTQEQNKGINANNTTGYKGVCPFNDDFYRAYICKNGKRKHLGLFKTTKEAYEARLRAEENHLATGTF